MLHSIFSYAASTSIGKSTLVKPHLQEHLTTARETLTTQSELVKNIHSVKHNRALGSILRALAARAHDVLNEFEKTHIDTIADLVGNHMGDYESIEKFKEAVTQSESGQEMRLFVRKMISLDNYIDLSSTLLDAHNIESLKPSKQKEVMAKLGENKLVDAIAQENKDLDINKAKKGIKEMGQGLCKELKLTPQETQKLVGVFDSITNKHLAKFNEYRAKLIKHLPKFMATELDRVKAVLEPKQKKSHKRGASLTLAYDASLEKQAARTISSRAKKSSRSTKKAKL